MHDPPSFNSLLRIYAAGHGQNNPSQKNWLYLGSAESPGSFSGVDSSDEDDDDDEDVADLFGISGVSATFS